MSTYTMTIYIFRGLYADEKQARRDIERKRWPTGPVCPYCGATTRIGIQERVSRRTRATVAGYYRCNSCQSTFTVRTGTQFQRSHVPLNTWLIAMFLIEHVYDYRKTTASILSSELGIPQKTAWLLLKRYRTANSQGKSSSNQLVPKDLLKSIVDELCEMLSHIRDSKPYADW